MGEELKPCPFCGYGGEPEIMTWREPYRSNIVYGVQCMACGAIGEMGKTRELAAKNWNEPIRRNRAFQKILAERHGIRTIIGYAITPSHCHMALIYNLPRLLPVGGFLLEV